MEGISEILAGLLSGSPICNQSAPFLIILVHSALNCPKLDASTEGETIALTIITVVNKLMRADSSLISTTDQVMDIT